MKTFSEYFKEKRAIRLKNNKVNVSDGLKHHLENNLSLEDNVFRYGSDAYFDLINELRDLYNRNLVELNEEDEFMVLTEAGRTGIYAGKEVRLDSPSRSSSGNKKYVVYVNSGRKNKDGRVIAKKVSFGDRSLSVKNNSEARRKSFLARHKCSEKSDRTTPGWWSCNVGRYAKKLGLSSSKRW